MLKVVGIGEYTISDDESDILKTYALASCVALIVYCPRKKVLGMAHVVLPSSLNRVTEQKGNGYFADLAVPIVLEKILGHYKCNKSEIVVRLYGGARSKRKNDFFNIGARNIEAISKILDSYNINFDSTETGGLISRTVEAEVSTGNVKIDVKPINI